jgi:hypothetical protein
MDRDGAQRKRLCGKNPGKPPHFGTGLRRLTRFCNDEVEPRLEDFKRIREAA